MPKALNEIRNRKIKSRSASTIDWLINYNVATLLIMSIFLVLPIILPLWYQAENKNMNTDKNNMISAGTIIYSIAIGYIIMDGINDWYRSTFVLSMIFIALFLNILVASLDGDDSYKDVSRVACGFIAIVFLFVLIYRNYMGGRLSDNSFIENAPLIGNYIMKIDKLNEDFPYNRDRRLLDEYRNSLYEVAFDITSYTAMRLKYKDPKSKEYKKLIRTLENLDKDFLGEPWMKGKDTSNPVIPLFIAERAATSDGVDKYIDKYMTEGAILRNTWKSGDGEGGKKKGKKKEGSGREGSGRKSSGRGRGRGGGGGDGGGGGRGRGRGGGGGEGGGGGGEGGGG